MEAQSIDSLLLHLDEYGTGRVSLTDIEGFAGAGCLTARVAAYAVQPEPVPRTVEVIQQPSVTSASMSILKLPLIVWIDDNHDSAEHNMYAKKAKDLGVHLVLVDSTAEAKLWIIGYNFSK